MFLNYSGTINARETQVYLSHAGMSLHPNFKVLGRLPYFLIKKMTSRRLCSEANSTSVPMGICVQKKSQVTTGQFDLKYLLNLNKFSTIG